MLLLYIQIHVNLKLKDEKVYCFSLLLFIYLFICKWIFRIPLFLLLPFQVGEYIYI